MSTAVLLPTQRFHEHPPSSPHRNAHASSSRTTALATPSSSRSPPPRIHSTPNPIHALTHHDHPQFDDLETVDSVSRVAKGKGRARSTPSTPTSSAGGGRFVCTFAPDQCSRAFTKRAKLEEHMLTHTGEVRASCSRPGLAPTAARQLTLMSAFCCLSDLIRARTALCRSPARPTSRLTFELICPRRTSRSSARSRTAASGSGRASTSEGMRRDAEKDVIRSVVSSPHPLDAQWTDV